MNKTNVKSNAVSITTIKYLAIIFMTIDHIGEFFPSAPIWFRYIGRLSSPLFFFAAAEGICHTHDKKMYLSRLYKLSVLLVTLEVIYKRLAGVLIHNNIFASIFHGTLIVYILEEYKEHIKKRNLLLFSYFAWQGISIFICSAVMNITAGNPLSLLISPLKRIIYAALGNYLYSAEGAFYLTMMIVLFYLCRNSKKRLAVGYSVYCIIYMAVTLLRIPDRLDIFSASIGLSQTMRGIISLPLDLLGLNKMDSLPGVPAAELAFRYHYQWMMIFVLPIILLYNGERGNYPKKLFYIYYPLHLFILSVLSTLLQK